MGQVFLEVSENPKAAHNARLKRYPDGSGELLIGAQAFGGGEVSKRRKDVDMGPLESLLAAVETLEDREERLYSAIERDGIEQGDDVRPLSDNEAACRLASVQRSVRRAKKAVQDLARSNDWAWFVTLTLDPEKVDRYDPDEVLKHLRHWLGNNVRRRGLRYVLVPEHHKDGAIHFHGLFNDALEAVDSGTMSVPGRKAPVKVRSAAHRQALEREGGHAVYNLPGWGWGFSTAIMLYGERDAAISYVCKYIGKEIGTDVRGVSRETHITTGKIGGRWYYSGGDLKRPTVEWFDVDPSAWENVPGWFRPDSFPAYRFLSLRVTSDGEILDPYVRSDNGDAKHESGRNPAVAEGGNAVSRGDASGVDCATRAGDFDRRDTSIGLPAGVVEKLRASPDEKTFDAILLAALIAGREGTGRDSRQQVQGGEPEEKGDSGKTDGDLTKAGLSDGVEKPGVEGRDVPPGQNDP